MKEIILQKNYLQGQPVSTIYFGGGTPSLLQPAELNRIMESLHQNFSIQADTEFTLEANPDDITGAKPAAWKLSGINRLSIGVQSFFDDDLRWMNRAHTAGQADNCIKKAQDAGIDNLSIDLIYGTPTLTDSNWLQNLEQVFRLNIPHLSCYALTVEEHTALDSLIKKNKVSPVNTDDQARQFFLLMQSCETAGYEHYEISNFSLPGKRSRHNSSYWKGENYLGLGPSAHSFNQHSRQWNVANNALYIQAINNNTVPFELEELTEIQQLNEYIMISLRTLEGLDLAYLGNRFGKSVADEFLKSAGKFIENGKLVFLDGRLIVTKEGKLFADGIAASLFSTTN